MADLGDGWFHVISSGFDVTDAALVRAFHPEMLTRVQEWLDAGLRRGRTEWHDDHLLALFQIPVMDRRRDCIWIRRVLVLATHDAVLTVDESPDDRPDVDPGPVLVRFRASSDRRPGRLVALIMDAVASAFVSVVDGFDAEANEIEDLLEDANPHSREGSNYLRNRLKQFRKDMHEARRAMQPTMEAVRQVVSGADLEGEELFPDEIERRLRDTLDKLLYASESLEGVRDEIVSLRDYMQARIANEQNEVMKTLTIVAALVLVPTFIVGFFGQNFEDMPGLRGGFWIAVVLMVGIVVTELVFLWWRGWIGNRGDSRVERAWRAAVTTATRPLRSVGSSSTWPGGASVGSRDDGAPGSGDVDAAFEALAAELPIGAEPVDVTRRWVLADSELRGVTALEALTSRIAAHRSMRDHMAVWTAAVLEVDDGTGLRDAVAFAMEANVTLALLTAANPMAVELSAEENERRNDLLVAEIGPPWRSVGRSPDGSWEESGFAMPFGPSAIGAGQRYGQAAIYRVSPDGVEVVVLVGADPEELT